MTNLIKTVVFAIISLPTLLIIPGITLTTANADYLRSAGNMSKCLGVTSGNNGAPLVIQDCQMGNVASQQWTYDNRTGLIASVGHRGKCLHKAAGGWANGNRIHLWDCNAGTPEMKSWSYSLANGSISARSNDNVCFHSVSSGWNNGTRTHLWADCTSGSQNRKWRITRFTPTDCGVFDTIIHPNPSLIVDLINNYLPIEQKVSKRKTLITHRARSVSSNGCKAQVTLDATMQRKIRKNASGTLTLEADLHSISGNYICIRNPKVTDVNLSNLGAIGENFYRRRGNRGFPDEMCVAL